MSPSLHTTTKTSSLSKRNTDMSSPAVRLAQQRLSHNGFRPGPVDGYMGPQTRKAIRLFQEAFDGIPGTPAAHRRLVPSGNLDRTTRIALSYNGRLSANFWAREFACKHCGVVTIHRDLVATLQVYRRLVGNGIVILSGTRCAVHNRNVGGTKKSQHLERPPTVRRSAVDIPAMLHISTVRKHIPHGGLGFQGSTGRVRHIDIGRTRTWRY